MPSRHDTAEDPPEEEAVLSWVDSLSNWGRWGSTDELGTLNLITPDARRRGASLVREGIAVPLAWDLDPSVHDRHGYVHRYMIESGDGTGASPPVHAAGTKKRASYPMEYLGLAFHGVSVTHLDAPAHCLWDGRMYNGFPASAVTSRHGARYGAVNVARHGVSGRGILIDLGEFDRPVHPSDVEEAERRQGISVEPGDLVLLRVGISARRKAGRPDPATRGGWHASMMPWLRSRDVALIGSDAPQETFPTGYHEIESPVHVIGLVAMGLWLVDNCDLESLAERCQELERWEFQLSVQPLPVRGGTGSPVAPVALF